MTGRKGVIDRRGGLCNALHQRCAVQVGGYCNPATGYYAVFDYQGAAWEHCMREVMRKP